MTIDKTKVRDRMPDLVKNLKEWHGCVIKANSLALQILARKEASANDIMRVHESLVRVHAQYRLSYKTVKWLLDELGSNAMDWKYGPVIEKLKLN